MDIGWWNPGLSLGGLVAGVMVGLTGMGGAALVTPMLVLLFGVSPTAAVSSDVVASAIMKPVGSIVAACTHASMAPKNTYSARLNWLAQVSQT